MDRGDLGMMMARLLRLAAIEAGIGLITGGRLLKRSKPQWIRQFLWLAAHEKLLTNVERRRRHISDSPICTLCSRYEESILHCLRDCTGARQIWRLLIPEAWSVALGIRTAISSEVNLRSLGVERGVRLIRWEAPVDGTFKVNTDGCFISTSGMATAGGLVRDAGGRWIGVFTMNIGYCLITRAELWGLFQGLLLAWDLGCRKVIVEVDN
ncbi:Polynucleotidyl transferase- ribonuclease H-like superfamily protein [Striga hermonthica]|uniref:Polynucleotidyl transferase- ribonuclease H-like superfamily protein n=1 Tax=Striga hermonthica TaxID=68872 RepID=A0A9N7MZ27_STRHE|nr:Polynucleotidyl transferase- ribonuclease H-like superfamily protein [Striga hermonthica]